MAAYNINIRCEDCIFADEYGRGCEHGLMYPVMVMIGFGDMGRCPNFKAKTNEQIERQLEVRKQI